MDIYLPPGNCQAQSQRQTVEDESAFSSGWGPCFPVSLPPAGTPTPAFHQAPPDESQCYSRAPDGAVEHHSPKILTSTMFLSGRIVRFESGEEIWDRLTVSMFFQETVQHVFSTEGFSHGLHSP